MLDLKQTKIINEIETMNEIIEFYIIKNWIIIVNKNGIDGFKYSDLKNKIEIGSNISVIKTILFHNKTDFSTSFLYVLQENSS